MHFFEFLEGNAVKFRSPKKKNGIQKEKYTVYLKYKGTYFQNGIEKKT